MSFPDTYPPLRLSQQPMKAYFRSIAVLRLAAIACVMFCLLTPAALAQAPPEIIIPPTRKGNSSLTAKEQKLVNKAIDRGVAYLRRLQHPSGIFPDGTACMRLHPCSFASLPGLVLLEKGVPPTDPAVQAAAGFVRKAAHKLTKTYDISLAILFLDRLGEVQDQPLIRSLALRLVAGETKQGGWTYDCPLLSPAKEKELLTRLQKDEASAFKQVQEYRDKLPPSAGRVVTPALLNQQRRLNQLKHQMGMTPRGPHPGDNSSTQFAILALGAARRYNLPLGWPIALLEQRFRSSQQADGWGYLPSWDWPGTFTTPSMTCVGVLGLALGHSADPDVVKPKPGATIPQDVGIQLGLLALGRQINLGRPITQRGSGTHVHYYCLWSVERVGTLCGVKTIGGIDWYRWGCRYILPAQRPIGNWLGEEGDVGNSPLVATCMALLFLQRADLLPETRKELLKRVQIVDPFIQGSLVKKSKKGPDLSGLKGLVMAAEDPLLVDLGAVPVGKPAQRPFRVRGPADFRITAIRGGDERLKVQADSLPAKVHNLTVTVQLDKAGPLERTLYLHTDLPGQAEVAVRLRLRATPASRSPKQ